MSRPGAAAAVERQVAADMIRRALPVLPALVLVAGLGWGLDGALSAAFAVGLVLANFAAAAAVLSWAAQRGAGALGFAALGSFVARLSLLTAAVLAVRHQSWVELVPLSLTLVVTHLGLLIWESRYVSLSLAFPVTPGRS